MNYVITRASSDELTHHGIKGQKWGVRRYQNDDGTWTEAGKQRYGDSQNQSVNKDERKFAKLLNKANSGSFGKQTLRSDFAKSKLLKSKQMNKLIDDDDLKSKYLAAKKATKDWYKLSKGEDFDAFQPNKNGYDPEYGITTKQFNKIMKLDDARRKADDEYLDAVQTKARNFISQYNANVPASKAIKSRGHDKQAEYWLSGQMQKAIKRQINNS